MSIINDVLEFREFEAYRFFDISENFPFDRGIYNFELINRHQSWTTRGRNPEERLQLSRQGRDAPGHSVWEILRVGWNQRTILRLKTQLCSWHHQLRQNCAGRLWPLCKYSYYFLHPKTSKLQYSTIWKDL